MPSHAAIGAAGLKKPKHRKGREAHAVAAPREKDLGDQRVVINVFYVQLGSPSKDDGAGRHATIGQIRVRMGDETPEACSVQRKLKAPA